MFGRSLEKPSRLVPNEALPPYSYVAGKFPHPSRDAGGHRYRRRERRETTLDPAHWWQCESYLLGIDMFNNGYYWEAHEAWEEVWQQEGRRGMTADFLKALIGLAAAGVKAREGRPNGVRQHAERAALLLSKIGETMGKTRLRLFGLELDRLIGAATELSRMPEQIINTSNAPVVVVMPFFLRVAAPDES